jgi:hypothetical protein
MQYKYHNEHGSSTDSSAYGHAQALLRYSSGMLRGRSFLYRRPALIIPFLRSLKKSYSKLPLAQSIMHLSILALSI